MSSLNSRQIKCLKLLWQEKEFRSAGYLAEKLQVSDKTVLQDIKVIQEYLNPFHITLIRKTGSGIYLPEKVRGNHQLIRSLESDSKENATMSTEYRRQEISKRLLLMDETGLSIQKLSEEFYVSRASIVNDFKSIARWGAEYNLTLVKNRNGRMFAGQEKGVRHAIAAWIRERNHLKNTEITPGEYISSRENRQFKDTGFFTEDEIFLSGEMMEHLEAECGQMVSEPYYSYLRNHILICISRVRRRHFITLNEEQTMGMQQIQLNYARGLLEMIREKWDAPDTEMHYLYKYLITSDLGLKKQGENGKAAAEDLENADLAHTVAKDLSTCVLKALRITVNDDSSLLEGLLQHVRPMLNRLRYDIHIQSSILADTQENYGELLGLCQSALWCISHKYFLKEVSLNEVSYIATYYQAMLEEKRMEKKILVVSNSGYGTTKLLTTKLRQHFPLYEIVDVISMIQLEKRMDLDQIDFVISTMPLENLSVPCILVSAVMSDADVRNIRDTISASWMEEEFSLEHLKSQYKEGKLELHTVEYIDSILRGIHSPYQEKSFAWGHCLQAVIGINTENKTSIYRRKEETDMWYLVTHARSYDELLEQLSEAYQMLCSEKGRRLTERCYQTEDLKIVFESQ